MDTIIFSGVGVAIISFAIFLLKKHNYFMSKSIEVPGEIVDIVERLHTTRGAMGGVSKQRLLRVPVVRYRYNKSYQFQSDIDITQKGLAIGSSVMVRIDPLRPKAAKLSVGLSDNSLFFKLMMGLGVFFIILGGVQYDPNDFNVVLFDNWFTLAFIVFGGIYLYIKLSPMFGFLKYNPLYLENAEEVDDR